MGKDLKVHKHVIILNSFLPKSKPYMTFANIRKKILLVSLDFCQNFDIQTFPRWLSIRRTNFFPSYLKLFLIVHFGPITVDGLLCIFIAPEHHTRKRFHRTLSIRPTNFHVCSVCDEISTVLYGHLNACWAYTEMISSMLSIHGNNFIHAEHTRNQYNATNCLERRMGDKETET